MAPRLLPAVPACRAVDLALGSPVNSFVITARECTRALARHRLAHRPGMLSRLVVAKDVWAVELRMTALRLMSWFADTETWLRGSGDGGTTEQQAALAAA